MKNTMKNTATQVLLTSVLMATLSFASVAQAELLHSYDLNNAALDGAGSINGAVSGAQLTTDRHGQADSAYQFDGNDAITFNIASPSTATYSVWATWESAGNYDMLFNTGANGSGPDLWFHESCDSIYWNTWDSCGNEFSGSTAVGLNNGDWHHYTIVNDASTDTQLYIDGALVGAATYKAPGGVFTLGSEAAGSATYGWVGKIDDVKIYNTALSAEEISNLHTFSNMQNSVTAVSAPVVGLLSVMLLGFAAKRRKISI
jgi:hypothetical protein